VARPGPLLWLCAGLALLAPSLGAEARAQARSRVALLLSHDSAGPEAERLRFSEQDADKMEQVLLELGGFRQQEILRVRMPDARGLRAALAEAEARVRSLRASGEASLLLVYYSGHAAGGALRLGSEGLPLAELRRFLEASQADVRIALLDACESGAITRLKGGRRAPPFALELAPPAASRGSVIITSSSDSEASQESDDLRGSFFTHFLVSGLRGAADRSGDGQVTLAEAYDYVYHRTVERTAGTRGGTQHPSYTYDLQGQGAVVLTRLGGGGSLLFPSESEGAYLIYDPSRDQVVAEVQKPAGRAARLALSPGDYVVKRRGEERLSLQELHLAPGQEHLLSEGAFRSVAFEDDVTKGPVALARLREGRRTVGLGVLLGGQAFFDPPTRAQLFQPCGLLGLRLELRNALAPRLGLQGDLSLGSRRSEALLGAYQEPVQWDFFFALGGLALSWDLPLGGFLAQAGPRLSLLYLRRTFVGAHADQPFQDLSTFSPGAFLRLGWQLGWLRLGLEGRLHYLRYVTEVEDRSLGFGDAYLTLGYER